MASTSLHRPKYRRHSRPGRKCLAVVRIAGRDHYLGEYDSAASWEKYHRLVADYLRNGSADQASPISPSPVGTSLTVSELILAYWKSVERLYPCPDGKLSDQLYGLRAALHHVRALYGHEQAAQFGPRALKACRQRMIDESLARTYINSNVDRIRRMFRWAVSEELLPVTVYQALTTVPGLRKGKSAARDTEPVRPVADAVVQATLINLPPIVADMVRFSQFTGCRPVEVCILRPCDVDRTSEIWEYRPSSHKTEHLGRERTIFIGPLAQEILRPYLLRVEQAFCFSPVEAEAARNAKKRAKRKTPMTPSQAKRKPKANPKRPPKDSYSTSSFRRAIHRACDKTFGEPQGPVSWEELTEMAKLRKLKRRDVVRNGTRGPWKRVGSMAGLLPGRNDSTDGKCSPATDGWFYKLAVYRWSPNQLRHSCATQLRRRYGIEAAQNVLGHSRADVTQVYAERDSNLARRIMGEIG